MIIGLGTDIAECARFRDIWERFGLRFAKRILTEAELAAMPANDPALYLASRFAVKEAAVKALGTGFSDGIGCRDAGLLKSPSGAPELVLSGKALEKARALGVVRTHVSYSHEKSCAVAVVILEGAR